MPSLKNDTSGHTKYHEVLQNMDMIFPLIPAISPCGLRLSDLASTASQCQVFSRNVNNALKLANSANNKIPFFRNYFSKPCHWKTVGDVVMNMKKHETFNPKFLKHLAEWLLRIFSFK